MSFGSKIGGWRPWIGALGVVAVALGVSLQLEGAPVDSARQGATEEQARTEEARATTTVKARPADRVKAPGVSLTTFKAGNMPDDVHRVVNVVTVDWRDDEGTRRREAGTLVGPLPSRFENVTAACTPPNCSFDVECDDGNKCTVDRCTIPPGIGACAGTCANDPVAEGLPGDCDDGVFCNGKEACKGPGGNPPRVCTLGVTPTCCSEPPADQTFCAEAFPRCDGGASDGEACVVNSDCAGGICEHCQKACAAAADCNDGVNCNGVESCQGGFCQPGKNPCGPGADCSEGECAGGPSNEPCNTNSDCPLNTMTCTKSPLGANVPFCVFGRCCVPDGGDIGDQGDCTHTKWAACISLDAASQWFAGDDGQLDAQDAVLKCGGNDPRNLSIDAWGCPKYGRGITAHGTADLPEYRKTVGPISDSQACVPGPGGPGINGLGGTCLADPNGPAGKLNLLGDDYTFINTDGNSHMGLDVMRWHGGVVSGNRVEVRFYDINGVFIEDIVMSPLAAGIGIQTVILNPSLTIPASGWVVIHAASDFDPNNHTVWTSTTNANGIGTQTFPNRLWINTFPTSDNNFLAPDLAILAMELVGDKESSPNGACCSKSTGKCEDNVLPWVCVSDGTRVSHGAGSKCSGCLGGPQNGNKCRTCAIGGAACDSDAACGANGPCNLNNPFCAAGTADICTAGNVGGLCTSLNNAQCDVAGTCTCTTGVPPCAPLLSGTCTVGAVGPCTNDADCNVAGVCSEPTCVALADCAEGACCATAGGCTETLPGGCSSPSTFKGFGTTCDVDHGRDAGEQHCCPQPVGLQCMGGPNNLQPCGRCSGVTPPNAVCDQNADCVGNGTCGTPTHTDCGRCTGNNAVCSDDSGCIGQGVCDGRCLLRGSGADDCEDAQLIVITVPEPLDSQQIKVVVLSGNNNGATSTAAHPDTCFDEATTVQADPGWWHRFSTNKCSRVRISMCCSDPVHQPQWAFISNDCELGCQTIVGNAPDPYRPGQAPNFRGPPWCPGEDNLWQTFGLLPAGVYAHPIYSVLAGAHGDYQVQITVEPCPSAACCYLECSSSTTPCDADHPCSSGTCDSKCTPLNQIECNEKLGFYMGLPQVAGANSSPVCIAGLCDSGSCCTGPGVCKDKRHNSGQLMTKNICEGIGFTGRFIGAVECKGGVCQGGSDQGFSCTDSNDCAQPNGVCVGSAEEKAQANPCPLCEIEGQSNCQNYDDVALGAAADLSLGTGHTTADDFAHLGGDISTVCFQGAYFNIDPEETNTWDCGADVPADKFRVRIYNNSLGGPTPTAGIPGTVFAERIVTGLSISKAERENAQALAGIGTTGVKVYDYQLALVPAVTGLTLNGIYWLEIANDTGVTPAGCYWTWMRLGADSPDGNRYSASGDGASGYVAGSESQWDLAWCLNTNVLAGGGGPAERACCPCVGVCDVTDLETCNGTDSTFDVSSPACGACAAIPADDDCGDASEVPVGTYVFNTGCLTTDGFNPVTTDFGEDPILKDKWFHFTVPAGTPGGECDLLASMCGTGAAADASSPFDSMIAIYTDTQNPDQCPCPLDAATHDRTFVVAQDENCYKDAVGGPSFAEIRGAQAGQCYTIRLGGFPGGDDAGTGNVNISCGPAFCGDGRRNGIEACDGNDRGVCGVNTLCTANCLCGAVVVCGNGVKEAGEECDPLANPTGCVLPATCVAAGPANQCTCNPFCGNNNIETGEDCDGVATGGDCPPAACTAQCECPALVCGNGTLEFGEECDQDSDCPTGDCRPLGDPLGECTCACGSEPALPPLNWSDADVKSRYLSFSLGTLVTSTGTGHAVKITMVNMQDPEPDNAPQFPAPDFSTFEVGSCTAPSEANGCARWVGPPATYLEAQDSPGIGNFRGARLQCTPYFRVWPAGEKIHVTGAEVASSSSYIANVYSKSGSVGPNVNMRTTRWGDVFPAFNPPSPTTQPDGLDVSELVKKFKSLPGARPKTEMQLQPNLPGLNSDVDATDILVEVDAFKGRAYPFLGPCTCPSLVTCGTACGAACTAITPALGGPGVCVSTCSGGTNDGLPCINNSHCLGSVAPPVANGVCGNPLCRDRCGRCN